MNDNARPPIFPPVAPSTLPRNGQPPPLPFLDPRRLKRRHAGRTFR